MINRIAILDHGYERFRPLTKTRPLAALLAGAFTFENRIRRLFPTAEIAIIAHVQVAAAYSARTGFRTEPFSGDEPVLFLLPNVIYDSAFARLAQEAGPGTLFRSKGSVVAAYAKPDSVTEDLDSLDLPEIEVDLLTIPAIWDLVNLNGEIIRIDFEDHLRRAIDGNVHTQAAIYGENAVAIDRNAEVFAGAILDARDGPIIVSRDAVIRPER